MKMKKIMKKDVQIICQSQTQRAIELLSLIGFPEGINNPKDKVAFTFDITEKLVRKQFELVEKLYNELNKDV